MDRRRGEAGVWKQNGIQLSTIYSCLTVFLPLNHSSTIADRNLLGWLLSSTGLICTSGPKVRTMLMTGRRRVVVVQLWGFLAHMVSVRL